MKLPLLLVLGCVAIAISYNQRMLDPLTALIAREMLVDPAMVVLLSPAFSLPYAMAQPILGPLSDSIGKTVVILACAGAALVATAVSYFVTDFNTLFALRMLTGVAAGGVLPVTMAMIADRTPPDKRQVALSRYMITMILAQLFTSPLSAAIAQQFNWHASMLVAVVLGIFGIGLMAWQIKPNPAAVRQPFSPRRVLDIYRTIVAIPKARICYAAVMAEGLLVFGFTPHVALYLEDRHFGAVSEAGFVLGGMGIGGLLYGLTVSGIVRRFTLRTTMNAGALMVAAGLMLTALATGWAVVAVAYAFIGFGFYMLHSGIQTQVTEVYPPARGSVVSLHACSMFLGISTGPMLVGALAARIGYRPVLIGLSLAMAGIFLLVTARLERLKA